ncbi:MAG TPA: hypothetical protein VIL46_08895 [Gemmataceae bacterium]
MRESVYRLVAEGKLPAPEVDPAPVSVLSANVIELLRAAQPPVSEDPDQMPIESVEILLAAVAEKAPIELNRNGAGIAITVANRPPWIRTYAKPVHYPGVIIKLLAAGLIEGTGDRLFVTEAGFQFADDVLSSRPMFTVKKAKCLQCSMHFIICTWRPERHSAKTLFCPECGQHRGKFLVWRQLESGFIFQMVPGRAQMEDYPTTS